MSRTANLARMLPLLSVLVCAGGCGGGDDGRMAVSGTITFHGKQLEEGMIEFEPLTKLKQDEPYTKSGAAIQDGEYSIPQKHGLLPGKYRVYISLGVKQEATGGAAPGPGEPIKRKKIEQIPKEYNENSQQVREVTREGPNEFNFDIP